MLQFSTINGVQLHFPTPILIRQWPEAARFHPELLAQIEQKHRESTGVVVSNRGGWQSTDDLLLWKGDAVAAFTQWCMANINHILQTFHGERFPALAAATRQSAQWRANAWANINKPGDWNATHNHRLSHWSGVHYLSVPAGSGRLAFVDPRPNISMLDTGNALFDLFPAVIHEVEPSEGMTVLFPSWLLHRVTTHEGDGARISIAFNVRFVMSGG